MEGEIPGYLLSSIYETLTPDTTLENLLLCMKPHYTQMELTDSSSTKEGEVSSSKERSTNAKCTIPGKLLPNVETWSRVQILFQLNLHNQELVYVSIYIYH